MTGTIKSLRIDKGFGFILAPNGAEFFFHRSSVKNAAFENLRAGQAVSFRQHESPKGPRAEEVLVEAR